MKVCRIPEQELDFDATTFVHFRTLPRVGDQMNWLEPFLNVCCFALVEWAGGDTAIACVQYVITDEGDTLYAHKAIGTRRRFVGVDNVKT